MKYLTRSLLLTLTVSVFTVNAADDIEPPSVVESTPASGDMNVDPATSEISITFSEPMADGRMSWAYEDKEFQNFKDQAGNSAVPFVLIFKTDP